METLLVEDWLEGVTSTPVLDGASVAVVRDLVRERAAEAGLPEEPTARLVNVASELAQNQLAHGRRGEVAVVPIARADVRGLEVRAADWGPGLLDPARAFRGGSSTGGTLGVGLAAVVELADEVDVDTRHGEGTCVCARVFAERLARAREVGIVGRALGGERVSGDDALVRRLDGALVAVVIDGLGHGVEAREAALVAKLAARKVLDREPAEILAACHAAAARTRGVVMTVARLEPSGALRVAGVGNVSAYVLGPKAVHRFGGSSGVVGARGPLRRVATEEMALSPYDALVMHTDGVSSRAIPEGERELLGQMSVVAAAALLERSGQSHDDALVLVAR